MKASIEKNIKTILYIEKKVLGIAYSDVAKKYVNPENYLWIKKVKWPFASFALLSKVSGISAFPEKRLKYWLSVFKNKGRGIKKRIGVFLKLPFEKVIMLPLNADFYFDKDCFGILLYINQQHPVVVKFNQWADVESFNKIIRETKGLSIANTIVHDKVKTPQLIKSHSEGKICFFEQELIFAKDLHSLPEKEQNKIYNEIFDFMYQVYKHSGVKLESPKKTGDTITNAVELYLNNIANGQKIVEKYKKLMNEDKKMLVGRIHGDLSLNNILTSKRRNVFWIIDWGESEIDYLAKDFKNNKESASVSYAKTVSFF